MNGIDSFEFGHIKLSLETKDQTDICIPTNVPVTGIGNCKISLFTIEIDES